MDISLFLPKYKIKNLLLQWLEEDIPSFDFAAPLLGNENAEAHLLQKESGIFCGQPFVETLFTGCQVEWKQKEGHYKDASQTDRLLLAVIKGPIPQLLQGERLALNLISRASGISTLCHQIKSKTGNWKGKIAGTRKTTPGLRLIEKYAMALGGADTHRMNLSSMLMLKDNHLDHYEKLYPQMLKKEVFKNSIQLAKQSTGFALKIEVECRNLEEALYALEFGADVIMLDNFSPEDAKQAAKVLSEKRKELGRLNALIEVSGGLNIENMVEYLDDHIDLMSMGCLSQGTPSIDFSFKIQKK